ncbi:MAG: hypothetical protein COT18_11190 [Elusimicrobia bacterium CG08_land_8_20_14_0_20_59_10]|nr:MAG: hypothetical protein COT18_11190 [Elusimicrobia bacterium CG08_land_8_20_14_0_20_59_10]
MSSCRTFPCNFTPLSERLSAGELVDFLNSYFAFITPPIMANRAGGKGELEIKHNMSILSFPQALVL